MIESATTKVTRNEELKLASPTLAGTIGANLASPETDRFSEDDQQFLKFHGIYQQDDRDKRKVAKHYMFMVRGRLPGGIVEPDQYLAFDRLATECANNTLRITTRQGFQFHGIVKTGLGRLMRGINDALCTTLAACGDVNRNVMAAPTPATSPLVDRVQADARKISDALLPKTRAYHQIWVEGKQIDLAATENKDFEDPLYGKTYLPRKFKVGFVIPPLNDIDILTNDLGFIAIGEGDRLLGYNLCVGGGLGLSHGNADTYARLADVLGFFAPEHLEAIAKAVLTIHRDFGDRTDRKHARLKYVVEERGADWTRAEIEKRAGLRLEPARAYKFTGQADLYGWHRQLDGKYFLGVFVEMGRIQDTASVKMKTAFRRVVERFRPEVRLTPSQNLLFAGVFEADIPGISSLLSEHGVKVDDQASPLRLAAIACPALPTCGLALAESERLLPNVITQLEGLLGEAGLGREEIVVRMTGCPNGCARPYMAEIAFVGRAPNKYQVYLGGNRASTRLNRLWRENVKTDEIVPLFRPVLARFAAERNPAEEFGDWCQRTLLAEPSPQKTPTLQTA